MDNNSYAHHYSQAKLFHVFLTFDRWMDVV